MIGVCTVTMGDPCVQKEKKTERHKKGEKNGFDIVAILSWNFNVSVIFCLYQAVIPLPDHWWQALTSTSSIPGLTKEQKWKTVLAAILSDTEIVKPPNSCILYILTNYYLRSHPTTQLLYISCLHSWMKLKYCIVKIYLENIPYLSLSDGKLKNDIPLQSSF